MKILYVASVMGHIKAFHLPFLKMLKDNNWEVHVAANDDMKIPYCDKKFILPIQRSPYKRNNYTAYKQLKKIIREGKYDIVHCHTPNAAVLTRLAARTCRKSGTKIIYTAHGFHFFKGAPLMNWIVYYPIEKWMSYYTDVLITINREDYARAQKFKTKKVVYILGVGVDIEKFKSGQINVCDKLKELEINDKNFVLLSVGELNKNKNHEVIIKAVADLRIPDVLYVLCGQGSLKPHLEKLAKSLNISNQIKFLGFRDDVSEIYEIAKLFVFPSLREGLSVSLMEAMANGLPCVASDIRGNNDLIENGKDGLLCKPHDVKGFADAIKRLIDDSELRRKMGKNNIEAVKKFDIQHVSKNMELIYLDAVERM